MPDETLTPPERLGALVQWQVGKITTAGARLTASRMPLGGRADYAILASLQQSGPMSQAELGRRLGLDRNDINAVVTRLDEAGHVDRQADPADRRRNIVTITSSGITHLDQLESVAQAVQDELLAGLDESERTELRRLLAKVLSRHGAQPA